MGITMSRLLRICFRQQVKRNALLETLNMLANINYRQEVKSNALLEILNRLANLTGLTNINSL